VTTRRTFLVALGAGLLGGPGVSLAQSRPARIGFLYVGSRQSALDTGRLGAFVQGMTELHYVEGTSFIIEGRFGDGKVERLGALAAELVRLKVDVIVATGTPSLRALQQFCEVGSLMSYGANLNDNFRRAATYVDKILKGARPSDLPFEQPTRYSLLINRKSAIALGLTLPQALLIQADEVIQ